MNKLCTFGGATLGSYVGWVVGMRVGIGTAIVLSGVAALAGVVVGWKSGAALSLTDRGSAPRTARQPFWGAELHSGVNSAFVGAYKKSSSDCTLAGIGVDGSRGRDRPPRQSPVSTRP